MKDAKGIPGWDKVYQVASALLATEGFGVTNAQAREIRGLYKQLLECNRRPLTFEPQLLKKTSGRFGRSKRTGNVSIEYMKRYIIHPFLNSLTLVSLQVLSVSRFTSLVSIEK